MRQKIFSVMFAAFVLFSAEKACAQSNVVVAPSKEVATSLGYYKDEVKPGETKKYPLYVTNTGDKEVKVTVYPADAVSARGGGKDFKNPDDHNDFVGSWYVTQKQDLTLKPKERKEVMFEARIPNDLAPGQYVGVLAVREAIEGEQQKTQQNTANYKINIVNKYGIQTVFEYNKEKAQEKLSIADLKEESIPDGSTILLLGVRNEGAVLQKPTVELDMRNNKGESIYKNKFQADSIYPATLGEIPFLVKDYLNAGDYTVVTKVSYKEITLTKTFGYKVDMKKAQDNFKKKKDAGQIKEAKLPFLEWIHLHPWISGFSILFLLLLIGSNIYLLLRKKSDNRR